MRILAPSVLLIKEIHSFFIRQYGEEGYLSEGMVEGCLEYAMTHVYDFKPFPKLFLKAAALLFSIITFHPFVDGNKRTAFQSTKLLLYYNGYELSVDTNDGVELTTSIAARNLTDIDKIAEWLKDHSQRKLKTIIWTNLLKMILPFYLDTPKSILRILPEPIILLTKAFKLYDD